MSEQTPTLVQLIAEAIEDVEAEFPIPFLELDRVIREAAYGVVPPMTTTLFAMVVADNSLAFLDCSEAAFSDPFSALSRAIGDAVLEGVEEHFASLVEG